MTIYQLMRKSQVSKDTPDPAPSPSTAIIPATSLAWYRYEACLGCLRPMHCPMIPLWSWSWSRVLTRVPTCVQAPRVPVIGCKRHLGNG